MTCPRIVIVAGPALLILGLAAGLVAAKPTPADVTAQAGDASQLEIILGRLDLSTAQRREVSLMLEEAWDDLERFQALARSNAQQLRAAELAQPFDARFVNQLVERQAVLMAFARGTESRLVAEVSLLLSDEQRTRFRDLRVAGEETTSIRGQAPEPRGAPARSDRGAEQPLGDLETRSQRASSAGAHLSSLAWRSWAQGADG